MSTLRTNEIKMLDDRGAGSFTFDSVADLKEASKLKAGQKVRTLGYYAPGDGGGNDYEIVAAGTGTDDGGSFIDLSGSGLQAKGLFGGEVNVRQFGAAGDDAANDTVPIQSAIDYLSSTGGAVLIPQGVYLVTEPIRNDVRGVSIYGESYGSASIKADPSFLGSSVIVVGREDSAYYMHRASVSDIVIDCNGLSVAGLKALTTRDGSTFSSILVEGNANSPGIITGMSGGGAGHPGGLMCQGTQFINCHVISQGPFNGSALWVLDGLFESSLKGCKALGFGGADNINSTGFLIGGSTESRGVSLDTCSAGNLAGASGGNTGIHYGSWAQECWDIFTTVENLTGSGFTYDGGTESGLLRPFSCNTISPRTYPGSSGANSLNPCLTFGRALSCTASGINNLSDDSGQRTAIEFQNYTTSAQSYNRVKLSTTLDPETLVSSGYVAFLGSADRNSVEGYGDTDSSTYFVLNNKQLDKHIFANGTELQNDEFWTTLTLKNSQSGLRVLNESGDYLARFDESIGGTNGSNMYLLVNINGTVSSHPVTIGSSDSGGTGYRVLRIPNS